jgi:hypothetical protein
MAGRRRFLATLTAMTVCSVAVGLTMRPDPPRRTIDLGPLDPSKTTASSPATPEPSAIEFDQLASEPVRPAPMPGHPVFRHSVVPGGVFSKADVEAAMFRMPDVAQHYRSLNIGQLAPAQVSRDGLYYASFKRDGAIFWTSYRLRVPAGEKILTDGRNIVRTRCGNLLSDESLEPRLPPDLEPSDYDMEAVEVPSLPMIAGLPHSPGVWVPFLPLVPVLVFPPGGGDHHGPGPSVPEPSAGALIGLGLAAIAGSKLLSKHRERQRRQHRAD